MTNPVCSFLAPECNITLAWLGLVETDGACLKTKLLPGIAIVPWHKIDYWQAIHLGCADFKNCESILSPILQTVVNNVNICIYNSLTCTYFLQCSPIQSKYKITINCFRTVVIAKCMILNHAVLEYQLSVIKQEQNPLIFLWKKMWVSLRRDMDKNNLLLLTLHPSWLMASAVKLLVSNSYSLSPCSVKAYSYPSADWSNQATDPEQK